MVAAQLRHHLLDRALAVGAEAERIGQLALVLAEEDAEAILDRAGQDGQVVSAFEGEGQPAAAQLLG